MGVNSYRILDKEWPEFCLSDSLVEADYMQGKDISWVSQVAPFIEELSYEGDLIFDPFAGLGTTLLACGISGRRSIGIELDENRFRQLKQRMQEYKDRLKYFPQLIQGDALQVCYPEKVDMVVTNFPYFHSARQEQSHNLYAIPDYEQYLDTIEKVIIKCQQALKPDGYMVVFTENIHLPNGSMLPQAFDICKRMQRHFMLKDERILLYPKPSAIEEDATHTNRAHEYVFIGLRHYGML